MLTVVRVSQSPPDHRSDEVKMNCHLVNTPVHQAPFQATADGCKDLERHVAVGALDRNSARTAETPRGRQHGRLQADIPDSTDNRAASKQITRIEVEHPVQLCRAVRTDPVRSAGMLGKSST